MTGPGGDPRPAHHAGYVHDLLVYGTDAQLLDVAVPFVRAGVAAGEPVLVRSGAAATALLRRALGPSAAVTFFDGFEPHPATSVARLITMIRHLLEGGAPAVRVIGPLPQLRAGGGAWDELATYEAVTNHSFAALPMWSLCTYDRRASAAGVVAEVTRAHPVVAGAGGRVANDAYVAPSAYLGAIAEPQPDRVEAAPPDVELSQVTAPHAVRAAVTSAGRSLLDAETLADLAIAVSEVTSNAIAYGRPPVTVRLWRRPERLVVTIRDGGSGPAPLRRGWLPPLDRNSEGGYGLWIARQCCDELDIRLDAGGCTVRLATWAAAAGSAGPMTGAVPDS